MQDPMYQDKSFEERFKRVVEFTRLEKPDAKVPEPVKTQETESELQQKAEQAVAEAGGTGPESLSQIPGGTTPEADEASNLSPLQLEALFETHSPEWVDDFLSKHA